MEKQFWKKLNFPGLFENKTMESMRPIRRSFLCVVSSESNLLQEFIVLKEQENLLWAIQTFSQTSLSYQILTVVQVQSVLPAEKAKLGLHLLLPPSPSPNWNRHNSVENFQRQWNLYKKKFFFHFGRESSSQWWQFGCLDLWFYQFCQPPMHPPTGRVAVQELINSFRIPPFLKWGDAITNHCCFGCIQ